MDGGPCSRDPCRRLDRAAISVPQPCGRNDLGAQGRHCRQGLLLVGWWKRPLENARIDAWRQLQDAASLDQPAVVGLFDSGTGLVYRAEVIGVILPTDEAATRVQVPQHEAELVPSYYRTSPFSSAWMKIKSIGDRFPFFENYSYDQIPQLPHYSPDALSRFQNKVILSATELRAMDTTIWQVRPRRVGDSTDVVYVTTPGLRSAVSLEEIACKSSVIQRGKHPPQLQRSTGRRKSSG
jgi:hypothetical protein